MISLQEKLLLSASILQYPDESALLRISEVVDSIGKRGTDEPIMDLAVSISSSDPITLQEEYVQHFDMDRKFSLYLTAWESGESRNRGMHILELKRELQETGFRFSDNELPDHIPLLLEFMAATEQKKWPRDLEKRIASFSLEAEKKLASDRYRIVFSELARVLAGGTEKNHENANGEDNGAMPYPLDYEMGGKQ